jgi:hypothetical protein
LIADSSDEKVSGTFYHAAVRLMVEIKGQLRFSFEQLCQVNAHEINLDRLLWIVTCHSHEHSRPTFLAQRYS